MENIITIVKKENAKIIDVREPWEFESGHISSATNIPLNEIPVHVNELKKVTGPIILYCRSGNRSGMATNILKQAGIKEVYNAGSLSDIQQMIMN